MHLNSNYNYRNDANNNNFSQQGHDVNGFYSINNCVNDQLTQHNPSNSNYMKKKFYLIDVSKPFKEARYESYFKDEPSNFRNIYTTKQRRKSVFHPQNAIANGNGFRSAPETPALVHGIFEEPQSNIRTQKSSPSQRKPHRNVRQHHTQKYAPEEPTWDCILSNDRTPNNLANQHYQHYFSYFYNRNSQGPKITNTSRETQMHTPITINHRANMLKEENKVINYVNLHDNHYLYRRQNQILKEKLANNNTTDALDNGEWHIKAQGVNITKVNNIGDSYEHKGYNPKRVRRFKKNNQNNTEGTNKLFDQCESGDAPSTLNNKDFISNKKPKEQLRAPRLPLTPRRFKGGSLPRKVLPSVHRVLLYNNQSPRSIRKLHMHDPKYQTKYSETQVNKVIVYKTNNSKISDEGNSLIYDDDVDEDDDLDNVSNFGDTDTASDVSSESEEGYRAYAYKLTHSMERVPTLLSIPSQTSEESLKCPPSLLVPSLFPNVPPYLAFSSNTRKGPDVPPDLYRILKWRVTNIMPKVVRLILANSGMRLLKKTNDWIGVWGKHLKSPCFKTIRSYQKINHLPGSFRIGRKDSCWKNLQRQMNKHSKREFGFMPKTYIIPNDLNVLRKHWPKYAQRNTKWIIKPPASARGAGIRVVNRWAQIPKRRPLIVQKYIERPLLINGSKFDLRLYVLVTSINPLRVYMYHNGLARFASVKYSSKSDTLNDRCMHLTNYSINKFSSNYSKNEDVNACHGHKWTIKSLWTYLANRGVRTDYLWEALRSLVLRTILSGENGINNMIRMNVESKYSVFELFGFDVILDSDLVPWLLEVNISPSLHSELPLDAHVKAPLVQGVLNTALYNVPPKLTQEKQKEISAEFALPPGSPLCYDKRMYINYLSREEKVKHNTFTRKTMEGREEYLDSILCKLTPDDIRCLIVAEDELSRSTPLERIFPTNQTYKYLKYTDTPRYYNRLLDAWETRYSNNRKEGIAILRQYCQDKVHLQVPTPPAKKVSNVSGEETNRSNAIHTVVDLKIDDTKPNGYETHIYAI